MKKLCTLIFTFSVTVLSAQNKMGALKLSNVLKPDIEKVASDYYAHFDNIRGEKILESINTIEYQSKIIPQGASECFITEIKGLHNVYSWEATMLQTEDFEKAVEKYKQIFRQLDGASVNVYDNKYWKFKGDYDNPDESRAFASSILEPGVAEKALHRMKIEVALNYNMSEWTVKILVYEKEADEDIRPTDSDQL